MNMLLSRSILGSVFSHALFLCVTVCGLIVSAFCDHVLVCGCRCEYFGRPGLPPRRGCLPCESVRSFFVLLALSRREQVQPERQPSCLACLYRCIMLVSAWQTWRAAVRQVSASESERAYSVLLALPGLDERSLRVNQSGRRLTVSGSRSRVAAGQGGARFAFAWDLPVRACAA